MSSEAGRSIHGFKAVVVTGASTGIGLATARVLIRNGVHVFGSVRKKEDGERLQHQFGSGHFTPLYFDVTDEAAVQNAARLVRECLNGSSLFGLVNNAGVGTSGPLLHQPISEFRFQQEVNLVGPLIVTQAFAPLLGAGHTSAGVRDHTFGDGRGRIVMMSSVAGKIGLPFLGAYAASKHGLEGMSESLRRELMLYGIEVIIVGPGSVATPIWDKAEEDDTVQRYAGTNFAPAMFTFGKQFIAHGRRGYRPERVGEVVWEALSARRPRVRYAVVSRPFTNWLLPTLLPKRIVDRFIAKRLGFPSREA